MKECFPEVDAGERLRQTHEGTSFTEADTGEDILLKQTHEKTHDKRFFANHTHALVHLTVYS